VDPRCHVTSITHASGRVCRNPGVTHATFHDLRHTFVTNARHAGIDYFRIMVLTGHKTMAVSKRYNTIDWQDLPAAIRPLDLMRVEATENPAQAIEKIDMGR
jgi:integrase